MLRHSTCNIITPSPPTPDPLLACLRFHCFHPGQGLPCFVRWTMFSVCLSQWCVVISPGLAVWTGSLLAALQLNQPWLAMWWHVCTTLAGWLGGSALCVCVCVVCVCVCVCMDQSGCKAGGWLLGYAWKTSGMCWCLHFSPLTGSICCSTIETVLDGLGVRDPGGFLHIWQCLALLPGESHPPGGWLCCGPRPLSARASGSVWIRLAVTSISTCFSNFSAPPPPRPPPSHWPLQCAN